MSSTGRRRPAARGVGLAVCVCLCALGAVAAGEQGPPSVGPKPGPAASVSPTPQPTPLTYGPPDGKWLVDDQKRDYYIVEVERREGQYLWVNAERTRVRLTYGFETDVVSYDEKVLRVKLYRPSTEAAPVGKREPTAEDKARIAVTYRPEARPGGVLDLLPFSAGLPQQGQWRNGFDLADVNTDGHADIVFGPARKGRSIPSLFLGNGAGAWTVWRETRFPKVRLDYGDAKVSDLNGDKVPDLVVASHLKGILAMLGDGKGGFEAWSQGIDFAEPADNPEKAPFSSHSIAIVDWNRDGRPDILAVGEGPQMLMGRKPGGADFRAGTRGATLYLNQGDGTWKKVNIAGSGNFGGSIAVADFDLDGKLDFVVGSDRRGFSALLHLGQSDGSWKETVIPALRPEGLFRAVASADFDRDGRPDIAVSFVTREAGVDRIGIDLLVSRPSGWERRTLGSVEGRVAVYSLASGDLDGDKNPDLVGLDGDGVLWIFRGDGKGGFTRHTTQELKAGEQCQGYGLRLADLDADGRDEIVVSFAEEPITQGPYGEDRSCPSLGGLQAWKVARK